MTNNVGDSTPPPLGVEAFPSMGVGGGTGGGSDFTETPAPALVSLPLQFIFILGVKLSLFISISGVGAGAHDWVGVTCTVPGDAATAIPLLLVLLVSVQELVLSTDVPLLFTGGTMQLVLVLVQEDGEKVVSSVGSVLIGMSLVVVVVVQLSDSICSLQ